MEKRTKEKKQVEESMNKDLKPIINGVVGLTIVLGATALGYKTGCKISNLKWSLGLAECCILEPDLLPMLERGIAGRKTKLKGVK